MADNDKDFDTVAQKQYTPAEAMAQLREKTGMTDEELAELTPEQLAEVAGGTDWVQTILDQWTEIKKGVVQGWNEA